MGLDVTVSHVIVALSLAGAAWSVGAVGGALFETLADARQERAEADRERVLGGMGGATVDYDPQTGTLTVSVENTGRVPLDPARVTLVLDGVPMSGVTTRVVGESGSTVWLPGERATFRVDGREGAPERVVLASRHGATAVAVFPIGPLSQVVIVPGPASVVAGGTKDFEARGYDAGWHRIGGLSFTWTTDAGTVETLGPDTARLTASGTPGSGFFLKATESGSGLEATATINIVSGPPASVEVTPTPRNVHAGGEQDFTAVAKDSGGIVIYGETFTWTADAGTVEPGPDTSVATFRAPTTTQSGVLVTATAGAASGSAVVDVVPGPPSSVTVTPDPVTVVVGETQAFTATVRDVHGNVNTTATVNWATDAGSIDASGVLTAPTTPGTGFTVTATAGTAVGHATFHVVAGPLHHAHVTPATVTLAAGGTQAFTATGHDQYHNPLTGIAFTWTASAGSVTADGVFTAPLADATVTVTATADGVSADATVTVVRYTYASAAFTDVAGGTVTNADAWTRDGGGDVATLDESATSVTVRRPAAQNERDFEDPPLTGWAITQGTVASVTQVDTDGTPTATGAMRILRDGTGGPSSVHVSHTWTQAAGTVVGDATFTMDYRFTSGAGAQRWIEAWLVKPDGSTVQIGSRVTAGNTAWNALTPATVPGAHLGAAGTYSLRFVVSLQGANDDIRVDNVLLTWARQEPHRFGKELTVPSLLPGPGVTYTLEVRYRVAVGSEALALSTEGPAGTWTERGTLGSTSFTTFTRTLTADEVSGGTLKLRLVDVTQSSDAIPERWEVDYVRVETRAS